MNRNPYFFRSFGDEMGNEIFRPTAAVGKPYPFFLSDIHVDGYVKQFTETNASYPLPIGLYA